MKRTLDSFFSSANVKKPKISDSPASSGIGCASLAEEHWNEDVSSGPPSTHSSYPFAVKQFPPSVDENLGFVPASEVRIINDQPDLDLHYYAPYIPSSVHKQLFEFLRRELFFYRVQYNIKRGGVETQINTPRFTTVFGVDGTSYFSNADADASNSDPVILEAATQKPVLRGKYKCIPRPLPHCLERLRRITEATTGETFNFCLVNYYASGADSISYHSDDERFLGAEPAIASFSLGAKRDFLMKHKPPPPAAQPCAEILNGTNVQSAREAVDNAAQKPLKFTLASGDMVLMRGRTQSQWMHSIPKRKGPGSEGGRINITFRKALVKGGTENYYQYNVGAGPAFKWDDSRREMMPWTKKTREIIA